MLKGRQIKGLRVITFHDGKEVGRVGDLLIDTENGMLQAITIESRSILKNSKIIKREHIVQVGRDAVMIDGMEAVEDYNQDELNKLSWQSNLGKNVFSREGADIGTVQDILFDFPEGRVLGIEMSGGIWADLNQGRKMIPWQQVIPGTEDNMIVEATGEDLWG
ncbi:MAG: PRC-barrel domain-containing protein [Bacillota bacterium]